MSIPLFTACSQTSSSAVATAKPPTAPLKLTIEAKEFSFTPAQPAVRVGQTVEILLMNSGVVVHDFTIEKIALHEEAVSKGDEHDMDTGHASDAGEEDLAVHVAAEAGHTGTVMFTPSEAGTYEIYCTVAGHRQSGMTGRLIVTAP
ncbi:MAG: cupredoxin domain-containing protein [Chloroflexi bacterium]|nr:cupredoxin domain-containing protein [Chloroflexota bacterium]